MGLEAELMTTNEAAELWGITMRRVQVLCESGKVAGAVQSISGNFKSKILNLAKHCKAIYE